MYNGKKNDEPEAPELEDMLQGRSNAEAYTYFCHFFLPHVVGKNRWRNGIRKGAAINTLATVSDEAFALLLLENSWDRWLWEVDKTKAETLQVIENETTPPTLHTLGKGKKARKNMGWTSNGLKRHQQIAQDIVEKDRKNDEEATASGRHGFDERYHEISSKYGGGSNKMEERAPENHEVAWLGGL